MLLRRLLIVVTVLLAGPAWATSPGQRALLFAGKITPVFQTNLTAISALPSQITFSRASNAMLTDSTGKLTYAPNNLLLNTATLSTQNVTTAPINYILSFSGTGTVTLTGTSTAGPLAGTGINNRVFLAFTPTVGTLTLTVSGSVTSAQLEAVTYQTTPSTYNAATAAAYYGPRFDYANNVAAGLLIEEQRTNVALQNRDLTNAAWTKTNVTAAKDQTGVDGVANSASSIVATAGNGTVLQTITLASSQRFQTAYVQRITGSGVVNMTTDGGSTWTAITIPGAGTWGRVSIPAQTVVNPNVGFQIVTNGDKIAVDLVGNETGAFGTSSIPTTTAPVVRSADIANFAGASLTALTSNNYSAIVEGVMNFTGATTRIMIGSGTSGFRVLYVNSTNQVTTFDTSASSTANINGTWDGITPHRAAYATDGITRSIVADGALGGGLVNAANSVFPARTVMQLGTFNSSTWWNGWIRKVAIYNSRLPDQTLTVKSVVGAPF